MSGYFTDAEGNKSSKRLIQFIVAMSGTLIALVTSIVATYRGGDIGSNVVMLVTGMVGSAVAGGAAVAFSNKGQKS
jgi:hypothetical protein